MDLLGIAGLALLFILPFWALARLSSHEATVMLRRFETRQAAEEARQVLIRAGLDGTVLDHSAHYAPTSGAGSLHNAYLLSVPRGQLEDAERALQSRAYDDPPLTPPA